MVRRLASPAGSRRRQLARRVCQGVLVSQPVLQRRFFQSGSGDRPVASPRTHCRPEVQALTRSGQRNRPRARTSAGRDRGFVQVLKDALDGRFAALKIRVNVCSLSLSPPASERHHPRPLGWSPLTLHTVLGCCAQSATALLQPVLHIRSGPTHLLPGQTTRLRYQFVAQPMGIRGPGEGLAAVGRSGCGQLGTGE